MGSSQTLTGTTNGPLWGARARDWAEVQEGQFAAGFYAVLDHVGLTTGTRLLDVGCGAGMAAMFAADRGARVAGIDAAAPMLDIARERVPEGDFRLGDLEELPFADHSFDVVTGFNAFQFAGNPLRALQEARRVVRPGGTVAMMLWGRPEGMEAMSLVAALRPLLPPPPPGAPSPFALSDPDRLRAFVADAGMTPREVIEGDCPWTYPDEATALRGINSNGMAIRVAGQVGQETVTTAYATAFAPFRQPDGSYCVGARYMAVIAGA
ncbi:MAG: class I SAM-dependent methyltransferase [Paracoccaceae bacterium]